ncbi:MAG: DUF86 domain-containing protein [Elusimicrobiota bacterium]|nr:DUF86 domain-containing protein [Elusimicrobiota bacterium]
MKRKASFYIKDIIDAITKIEEFIENIDFNNFIRDDKTTSAVIRKIEIIGEATKQLPKDIKDRFPEIPWSSMAKTRDKIIHFYHSVDYKIVWEIIKKDLPPLKIQLTKLYNLLLNEGK